MAPGTTLERFVAKLRKGAGECWTFIGAVDPNGYGRFWMNGRMGHAHRAAYELFVGPIPDGLDIDHLCHNRACVNPAHLEAVTRSENVRRRSPQAEDRPRRNPPSHGSINAYTNYGCRCDACCVAGARYNREYRARRFSA